MGSPDLVGFVLALALAGIAIQAIGYGRRWSRGAARPTEWIARLLRFPRAYLTTVHEVVARDPAASRMHMLVAGGMVGAFVLSLILHGAGLGGRAVAVVVVALALVSLAGAALDGWRRRAPRPRRLSGGRYTVLPIALAGLAVFLCLAALPIALAIPPGVTAQAATLAVGVASLGWLVGVGLPGPMRHALAGTVHLIAHDRPLRFEGVLDSGLKPLDLAAERLGVGRAADFPWNRLASFDACVQCGRCEAVCPAFAAGQPLNPKKLIHDLVIGTGPGVGRPYAGSPHPGLAVAQQAGSPLQALVDAACGPVRPETLWACTTCRACVYECPMLIEHVDAVVDLRRYQTLEIGAVPPKAAEALTTLRETDTVSGRRLDARLDWAADLKLPTLSERGACDVLLWLGDSAYDRRNQRTLVALVRLLRLADIDVAVLGAEELDCGDLARRMGDEATFQALAARNLATLARYRFNTILTADPHVLHTLGTEYPAFGASHRVVHHTTFLDGLLAEGRLTPAAAASRRAVTYHDPCYLGRYAGEVGAPRRILERIGIDLTEMTRSGLRSSCCGGGGGAPLADVPGDRRIPDVRMDHARDTGAALLATACPYCAQMLEGVVGPRPEVADIAELLLAAVEALR